MENLNLDKSGGLKSRPDISSDNNLANNEGELRSVSSSRVSPNPNQPRRRFDEQDLNLLADSIAKYGLLQPLVVVTDADDASRFVLVAGERRLRASRIAGLKKIPVLVRRSGADMLSLALVENIQRENLNVIEEARGYEALICEYGLTQEECGIKVGKDRSTITNMLRLLTLPELVIDDLISQRMTSGHARALLTLADRKTILTAREIIIKKALSVRKTEVLCKGLALKSGNKKDSNQNDPDPDVEYLADNLRGHLRTKVNILGTSVRGKIEVSYFSTSELERLVEMMQG